MAIKIEDRPTTAVRDEVVDQLVFNYSHGKLSAEAFERRLDQAMESEDNIEIAALAEDLEPVTDKQYAEYKKRDLGIKYATQPAKDNDTLISIFGGNTRSGRWTIPKEINSYSIFGGSTIDFTDAEFYSKEVTVNVFCLFGGDDIFVPENVNVVTKAFCIFGGVDNSAPNVSDRHAPTIIIEGLVIFGGVDVKIKRTIKEKLQSFADNLKRMFE